MSFMYAVLGRELEVAMKTVVSTRRAVKFVMETELNSDSYMGNVHILFL